MAKTVLNTSIFNADIDSHINTSTASANEVLSYTGSDYDWVAQATTDKEFTVTHSTSPTNGYYFSGVGTSSDVDPTLYLIRGETYKFIVSSSSGSHPFYILTAATYSSGAVYSDGVTNNGTNSGTVTFTVPMDAPDVLYYACASHGNLSESGTIYILKEPTIDTLGELTDVNSSISPLTNEVLGWDNTNNRWDSVNIQTYIEGRVDNHLNKSSAQAYQNLQWNGSYYSWTSPTTRSSFSVTTNTALNSGYLTYNSSTGVFNFAPPDLSSYLTAETNDLSSAVTWANVPNANITESSVTQHQSALSITESQISDLQSYLTSYTETDTLDSVTGRGNSTTNNITVGNATITGNLTVQGTTTTLETATLNVEDKNITINYSTGDSSGSADGAGITIQDAVNSTTDATILWDAIGDKFEFSHAVDVTGNITVSGTVDGRDLATDGSKLDGIEASADVTDATNVAAAGAVMDGDFTANGFMKRTGAGTYTVDTNTYLTSISVGGLSDITVTNVADNEVLAYDSSSSGWINQTAAEAGLATSSQGALADSALQPADLSVTTNTAGTAALSYSNGVFTYTPPDLSSYLTAETNDLTSAVTWANVPNANITESSVTQHQSALSITESQISDFGTYLTGITSENVGSLSDVTISSVAAGEVLRYSGSAWVNSDPIAGRFSIVNSSSSAYVFTGSGTSSDSNPTLYLTRGQTYEFVVNASGHPFYIKTVSGTGTGNAYSDGVTNNGAETGTVTLAVQMDAPDTLYYNCSAHSAMAGTIYVLDSTVDLSDFSVTTNSAGTAALSYSNGVFTYTPPDLSSYLTAETNDLTSAVTWANVPNANITESSVTQHQSALSITESQISDLQTYLTGITGQSIENLSDVTTMTPTDGQVLTWDNTNSYWYAASPSGGSYNNSSVDSHLNTSSASTNEVLSWNGSDYAWVSQSGGSGIALTDLSVTTNSAGTAALSYNNTTGVFSYTPPDLSSYLTGITAQSIENLSDVNTMTPTDGQVLTWDNANSRWDAATPSGGGSYSDSSVDTHLNTSTASANQVLSWTGSDYDWVAQSGGGGGGSSVTVSETAPSSPSSGDLWFDPNALKTYVYYNDGDSNQWVQANPSGGGSGALVVSKNIALNFFFGS